MLTLRSRSLLSVLVCLTMGVTVKFFTLVVLFPQVPSSHQHLQYTPPILALGQ